MERLTKSLESINRSLSVGSKMLIRSFVSMIASSVLMLLQIIGASPSKIELSTLGFPIPIFLGNIIIFVTSLAFGLTSVLYIISANKLIHKTLLNSIDLNSEDISDETMETFYNHFSGSSLISTGPFLIRMVSFISIALVIFNVFYISFHYFRPPDGMISVASLLLFIFISPIYIIFSLPFVVILLIDLKCFESDTYNYGVSNPRIQSIIRYKTFLYKPFIDINGKSEQQH